MEPHHRAQGHVDQDGGRQVSAWTRALGLTALALGAAASGCKGKTEAVTSPLGGSFEGAITVRVDPHSERAPFDVELRLKQDNVRLDLPGLGESGMPLGKTWGVFRAGEKKGFFALEAAKQAYTLDLDAAGDDVKRGLPARGRPELPRGQAGPTASVKRTGQKATIAGIPCEDWELRSGGERALVCVAEESASWLKFPTKALPDDLGFAAELLDGKHFPVRVIAFDGARETSRIEITKLDKRPIPDADFQVPAGYATIDVAQMLKLGALTGGAPRAMPGMIPLPGLEDMPMPGPGVPPGRPLVAPAKAQK